MLCCVDLDYCWVGMRVGCAEAREWREGGTGLVMVEERARTGARSCFVLPLIQSSFRIRLVRTRGAAWLDICAERRSDN